MEILERKENDLLDRIEIDFRLRHEGKPTPSRNELLDMITSLEPNAKRNCVVVKDVNTRFGQPTTTGVAHVYGKPESMVVEAAYVLERHGVSAEDGDSESSSEPVVATEVSGGEE